MDLQAPVQMMMMMMTDLPLPLKFFFPECAKMHARPPLQDALKFHSPFGPNLTREAVCQASSPRGATDLSSPAPTPIRFAIFFATVQLADAMGMERVKKKKTTHDVEI